MTCFTQCYGTSMDGSKCFFSTGCPLVCCFSMFCIVCLFVCLFVCSKNRSTQCEKVYVMGISTTCKTNEYVSHYFQSCLQQRLIYPLASNTDIIGLVTHSWGGMDCVTGTKNVCVGGYVSLRHSRLRVVSNFGDGD